MRLVIATGIYPPEIGGTATYAYELAKALRAKGHEVAVVTYGESGDGVIGVARAGFFYFRWRRYAQDLRENAENADAIIAMSSVSVGIPLMMAKLKKPKKILRLGGDFFWERYTDAGGRKSLREWYLSYFGFWRAVNYFCMPTILRSFDALVYSTEFQRDIHDYYYSSLPQSLVLENAVPLGELTKHFLQNPMKILAMSRYVGFKNLESLITAMSVMQNVRLTMIGGGPLNDSLRNLAKRKGVSIDFRGIASDRKQDLFKEHDLLVIPSVTEISPNTALEARAAGLPVLLTKETGLSSAFTQGMIVRPLQTSENIVTAVNDVRSGYDRYATEAATPPSRRSWSVVADEWMALLQKL